nr:mitochondrial import receptor subunit TOM40-1-like [Ipomoea batatas]GMD54425.1 mitochondrial import receptor subunit TOM40-1-like [Ipomoea batatas]
MLIGRRPTDELFKDGLNLHSYAKAGLAERGVEIADPKIVQERVEQIQIRNKGKYYIARRMTNLMKSVIIDDSILDLIRGNLGKDYRFQFQLGSGALLGASYIQSVTPYLSLGGEVFWAGQHRKSGIGYVARYNTDKMVAAGQVASTGIVALSYVQKVSEKVSLASDFMYNYLSRDVTASFGYDYILRQCRLRGKIDSNGCIAAFLEERLNMGLNFILSAEVDHKKKDYKFGFGLTVGE